jgi:hypothetical protein
VPGRRAALDPIQNLHTKCLQQALGRIEAATTYLRLTNALFLITELLRDPDNHQSTYIKSMSTNDRRAVSYNLGGGSRPRVASSRAEHDYRSSLQDKDNNSSTKSPRLLSENTKMDHLRGSTQSARGLHRESSSGMDRRTERTTITSREKVLVKTRNPVKESPNAGNRGEFERSRSKKTASPPRRRDREVADGSRHRLNSTINDMN